MENSTFEDKILNCKTCMQEFKWSAGEQKMYERKGFKKTPQKCQRCRENANRLRPEGKFYIRCAFCDKDGTFISPPPKDKVSICGDCMKKIANPASN